MGMNYWNMKHKMGMRCPLVVFFMTLLQCGSPAQQFFRTKPKDMVVIEGGEVILECVVGNLAGKVQWAMDGFALGYTANPPGYPRYSVVGDSLNGVFNLRISNATLEDDAQFQCQVSPNNSHKAIRAVANLTVLVPPTSVEFVNLAPNSKVEVKEHENLVLECLVNGSKPAASIAWFRGKNQLKHASVTESKKEQGKRWFVSSKINYSPTQADDRAEFSCEAHHKALLPDIPYRTSLQLSVLYPPERPYIEGYKTGSAISRGQTLDLVCKSRGGNPPAQLIWYKNDAQVNMMYRTTERMSENALKIVVEASDNNAVYKCTAKNVMSKVPLITEIALTVYYGPAQVTISGMTEAKINDSVQLSCSTSPSNPASSIKWTINGKKVDDLANQITAAAEGGWVTSSNLIVNITSERVLIVICYGINNKITDQSNQEHIINVLYPPGKPLITGYEPKTHIHAGTIQKISCVSQGGNPLPILTWYKNDIKVDAQSKTKEKLVTSELAILLNASDNGAIYKCSASNSATDIPLFETVELSVYFPPEQVVIRVEPNNLRSGIRANLICDGSSSNPPAELNWSRDGVCIYKGVTKSIKSGELFGGEASSIQLVLNVTHEMDEASYTCQATNSALDRSVHNVVDLHVLFKPVFTEIESNQTGIEGDYFQIVLQARGQPANISYSWTKDRIPLHSKYAEGPFLNITRLKRSDAGFYVVTATNSEGSSDVHFNISVQYAANITNVSENVIVPAGEEAELWCKVDGNPLKVENDLTWRRPAFNMDRTVQAFNSDTTFLTVKNISIEDMGIFQCIANNGIGNDSLRAIFLAVKHKPTIKIMPHLAKAAANVNSTARLICRASGAPRLSFQWSRNKTKLSVNSTGKYVSEFIQIDEITFESVLSIRDVESSDYGPYDCTARNDLGFSSSVIQLLVTSVPDPPAKFRVLNVTHDSVALSWEPGFNGGISASYEISFRPISSSLYHHIEINQNTTEIVVTGLDLGTQYLFNIRAKNSLGESEYSPHLLEPTTSSTATASFSSLENADSVIGTFLLMSSLVATIILLLNALALGYSLRRRSKKRLTSFTEILHHADLPLMVALGIALTAGLLLALNICLVVALILRKRRKQGTYEQSSGKSATIEMYAPNSYTETITGETLSSMSEKRESYSDNNAPYGDDDDKTGASTYIIEQIDYPFQYPMYDPIKESDPGPVHGSYINHNGTGMMSLVETPYYSIPIDTKYITNPPPAQFVQLPTVLPPPQRANPPDVTVSSAPPPSLKTFSYSSVETKGHLV